MCENTELAWAAGFFDGEGSIFVTYKGHSFAMAVAITQVDREVLDRFRNAVGVGAVTGPYKYKEVAQPSYRYQAGAYNDIQNIIADLYPFLSSVKRNQCVQTLVDYELKRRYLK